jgi:hypothetical protein
MEFNFGIDYFPGDFNQAIELPRNTSKINILVMYKPQISLSII